MRHSKQHHKRHQQQQSQQHTTTRATPTTTTPIPKTVAKRTKKQPNTIIITQPEQLLPQGTTRHVKQNNNPSRQQHQPHPQNMQLGDRSGFFRLLGEPPNAANPVRKVTHLNHRLKVSGSYNCNLYDLTKPEAPDRVARALVTMALA